MGGFSLWHWLVVGLVILLLFGRGRFSEMMGDVAKGLKNFKKGMNEDEDVPGHPPRQIARDPRDGPAVVGERPLDPVASREPVAIVPERPISQTDVDRRA